jgi:hypothetical protein
MKIISYRLIFQLIEKKMLGDKARRTPHTYFSAEIISLSPTLHSCVWRGRIDERSSLLTRQNENSCLNK